MMPFRRQIPLALALACTGSPLFAQSAPTDIRDEIMRHFENSTRKIVRLAEAMPESLYTWRPSDEVMSVAQVYMHIARYNFEYPQTALGVQPPADIDVPNLESITEKERVRMLFDRSVEHVRHSITHLPEQKLIAPTRLYGRDIAGWAVLLQLVSHMNEHVGQSVAYARMNGVVPPWSR